MAGASSTSHPLDGLAEVWGRRKWLAMAVLCLVAAVGTTIARSLPNLYRSTATVIVEQGRMETSTSADVESRLQLISQEIFSRSRLETVIRRFNLYPSLRGRASMEALVDRMRRDIRTESKVQPQPNGLGATIAFAISYRGAEPHVVAKVANALASFHLEEEVKIRERQTSGTLQVLEKQLEDVKRDLQEQEAAQSEYQEQHLGELPQQVEANVARLDRLGTELRTISDERMRAIDRRNELLRELSAADSAAAAPAGSPSAAAAQLDKKKEELAELRRRYSDKYPDVIRVREEVAALEREAADSPAPAAAAPAAPGRSAERLREALAEVESEIKGFRADETSLRGQIDGHIRRLENAPRRQRASQEIGRDYQTTRDLYDSLRKRYELAQLEEGAGAQPASLFRILDPALVPVDPVAPNRLLLLFLTALFSLGAAAAAAVLAEHLDTTLHTADAVRAFTRVPVLASIPRIQTAGDLRSRRLRVGLGAASALLAAAFVVHAVHHVSRSSEGVVSTLTRGRL